MPPLTPFAAEFFVHALAGGSLVAVICGVVGTWVVIRGMARAQPGMPVDPKEEAIPKPPEPK